MQCYNCIFFFKKKDLSVRMLSLMHLNRPSQIKKECKRIKKGILWGHERKSKSKVNE